jgi:glycosyltransferase involved in cell wall biosynthesis
VRQVAIVAPGLGDLIGHEFEYTRGVSEAFRKRGVVVRILGRADAVSEVRTIEGFLPAFRWMHNANGRPSSLSEIYAHARVMAGELRLAVTPSSLSQGDLVFAHTIPHSSILAWLLFFVRHRGTPLPKIVLLHRFSLEAGHRPKRDFGRAVLPLVYRLFFGIIRRHGDRVRCVVDSENLQKEYQRLARFRIHTVPIPIRVNDLLCPGSETQERAPRQGVHLLYLGDARTGKGFDLLPSLVEGLWSLGVSGFTLTVHCGRAPTALAEPEVLSAYQRLERLADAGKIRMLTGSVSYPLYAKCLRSSDAVVLPYRAEHYRGQTSNVLAEAFVIGKPAVAPEGTWMGDQVRTTGSGTVFESGKVSSLVQAIKRLVQYLPQYSESACRNQSCWARYHNPEMLVRELEALAYGE